MKRDAPAIVAGQTWRPRHGAHELDVRSVHGDHAYVNKVDRRVTPERVVWSNLRVLLSTIRNGYELGKGPPAVRQRTIFEVL
jgi:hypothetical protein